MAQVAARPLPGAEKVKRPSPLAPVWRAIKADRLAMFGVIMVVVFVLLAVFAPIIAPYDPNEILEDPETGLTLKFQPPSLQFPFGTNNLARDVFSQVVYGSRVAL